MVEWTPQARKVYRDTCDSMLAYLSRRGDSVVRALAASGRRELPWIRDIDNAESELRSAFARRWDGVRVKSGPNSKYSLHVDPATLIVGPWEGQPLSPQQTATDLLAYARVLTSSPMPLLASTRYRQYSNENSRVRGLLQVAGLARADIIGVVQQALVANAGKLSRVFKNDSASAQRLQVALNRSLPPGIADRADDLLSTQRSVSSFVLQLGNVGHLPPQLLQHSIQPISVDLASGLIPLVVDLHAEGGLATTSESALRSAITRLLALNVPGSIKVQVFDRQGYGKIIDFLLDLDTEAQKQIMLGPIVTTSTDLRTMLEEVERHIGFVTQKYLGGKHSTLKEYNESGGDITEPSRLVVFTGYPDGFTHASGGADADLAQQLNRIIQAGPAAGVYTLVLGNGDLPRGLPWFIEGSDCSGTWAASAARLAQTPGRLPAPDMPTVDAIRSRGASSLFGLHPVVVWQSAQSLDRGVIKRSVTRLAADLTALPVRKVTPAGVAALGTSRGARVLPDVSSTWWQFSSADGIEAPVGRRGVGEAHVIRIESTVDHNGLLVGGRSRSGKSTFLHAFITELARRYGPHELQFCLIDLKNGVEFGAYRKLPHARIVGLEAGAEFGVAVLESLIKEMKDRTVLFDAQTVSNLRDYRLKTGNVLPRVLVVIDEFMFAFERQGSVNQAFGTVLQRVIKQGGAYGVHLVLATQTISQGIDVPRDALREIPMRVALQCDEGASRLLLSDANPAAALLEHPGEALYNGSSGAPSANTPFQSTFVDVGAATDVSAQLAAKARAERTGHSPRIFNTRLRAPYPRSIMPALRATPPSGQLAIPLGLPFGLGRPIAAKLSRAPGGNLLAVVPPEAGAAIAACGLAVALNPRVRVVILDFGGMSTALSASCSRLMSGTTQPPGAVVRPLGRQQSDALGDLDGVVNTRQEASQFQAPPVLLLLLNLEQAGILKDASASRGSLEAILRDGPAVGVHTMVVTEAHSVLERRLGSYSLEDFDHRIVGQLASDVSIRVIDSADTSDLSDTKLKYYDKARGLLRPVLAFDAPPPKIWTTP